jgi:hypothetical protein
MGVNAQTAVPAFTAGQVLTAAQMTEINTGIPVFATTTTRDAAFGGTGEKVLAEGQYAYIEATNTTQFYDGAAWQTVGQSGLTFLVSNTFSAVASVSLPNDTFTSTYTNYKVVFVVNTADATRQIFSRLRAAGADSTASAYNNANGGGNSAGSFVGYGSLSATSFLYPYAGAAGNKFILNIDVSQPQIAESTYLNGNAMGLNAAASQYDGVAVNQLMINTTQFDAMTFFVSAGNMTGNYTVYGYAKS